MSLHNRYQQTSLTEDQAKQVLQENNIPTVDEEHATTPQKAAQATEKIGYPAVIKINSPDISHKSDIGGVITVNDGDDVEEQCNDMLKTVSDNKPEADIQGFLVAEEVDGREFILGINTDPQFGKAVMFGLGGVNVELFNDISIRLVPLTRDDARDMIDELEASTLLDGYRGTPATDKDRLADIILAASNLAQDHPEIHEMDINPLFINGNQIHAADALITLEEPQ